MNSTSLVPTTIINIQDQYFYVARVPFETRHIGSTVLSATPNTLEFAAVCTNYTRSATVNSSNAVIAYSSRGFLSTFPFGGGTRGLVERVDLQVNLKIESFSEWALRIFGTTNVSPTADFDGDGANNYLEYLAGTDPRNNQSLFIMTDIQSGQSGGIDVRWQSVAFKTYTLLRSGDLQGGFAPIKAGIAATPATNFFHDATANGPGPYYYRAKLEGLDAPTPTAPFKLVDIYPSQSGGVDIRWQSQANKTYSIYRSTNLGQGFVNIQAFIPSTPGTNTFHDATATGVGPYFYRIRVE